MPGAEERVEPGRAREAAPLGPTADAVLPEDREIALSEVCPESAAGATFSASPSDSGEVLVFADQVGGPAFPLVTEHAGDVPALPGSSGAAPESDSSSPGGLAIRVRPVPGHGPLPGEGIAPPPFAPPGVASNASVGVAPAPDESAATPGAGPTIVVRPKLAARLSVAETPRTVVPCRACRKLIDQDLLSCPFCATSVVARAPAGEIATTPGSGIPDLRPADPRPLELSAGVGAGGAGAAPSIVVRVSPVEPAYVPAALAPELAAREQALESTRAQARLERAQNRRRLYSTAGVALAAAPAIAWLLLLGGGHGGWIPLAVLSELAYAVLVLRAVIRRGGSHTALLLLAPGALFRMIAGFLLVPGFGMGFLMGACAGLVSLTLGSVVASSIDGERDTLRDDG